MLTGSIVTFYRLEIGPIKVAKDEFLFLEDPKSQVTFDLRDFEALSIKKARVKQWKRVETTVTAEHGDTKGKWTVILEIRSDHLQVSGADTALPRRLVTFLLAKAASDFAADNVMVRLVRRDPERGLVLLAVDDVMWWAGVLHKMAEIGPLEVKMNQWDGKVFQGFQASDRVGVGGQASRHSS